MHLLSLQVLPEAAYTALGSEVYRGLTSIQKSLSPWIFYDAEGSRLFEEITRLPEYYPTRTERGIFLAHAQSIVAAAGPGPLALVELGAGTAAKTGVLLQAAVRQQGKVDYYPIDVSDTALEEARQHLESRLPGVVVHPQVADYTEGMGVVDTAGCRKLVLYIGSSIGNFDPAAAHDLLLDLRRQLDAGDNLLLGVDMVKDSRLLLAAYNDRAGITAAFNKNALTRINRELNANFDLKRFRHRAIWNEQDSRIEMHLESTMAQRVCIESLELDIAFQRGETIHTENSYKFTPQRVEQMLSRAGFASRQCWSDAARWFGVYLATAF